MSSPRRPPRSSSSRSGVIRPTTRNPGSVYGVVSALIVVVLLIDTAAWLGAHLAANFTGAPWSGPPWTAVYVFNLAKASTLWPGVSHTAVFTGFGVTLAVLLAAAGLPCWLLWRVFHKPAAHVRSMATGADMSEVRAEAVGAAAIRLQPSLAKIRPRDLTDQQRGLALGDLQAPGHPRLFATWEDVILAVFAPRSGKTSGLAVPMILGAPGPVVGCSNKPDLYLLTASLRAQRTGEKVWVFDPQHIGHVEQTWWWNPLGGQMTLDDAVRLAGGFVMSVADDERREIWGPAAGELLSGLFLAGHLKGMTLMEVYETWLFDEGAPEPVNILRAAGHRAAAAALEGQRSKPGDTRGSVYFTAQIGMSSMRDIEISKWVEPGEGLAEFVPAAFVGTRETLYMMSKGVKGGTSASAIVAALTSEIRVHAERLGERLGGRVDPPLLMMLDEAGNICRIADLPEVFSHVGSRSIIIVAILQSYAQGERVWGRGGMKELWGAATVKLIGSGADDQEFAENMSRLVGEHDVDIVSYNGTSGGAAVTSSVSTRRERILTAAQIREMPKNQAILLRTGTKAAMLRLNRWFESADAPAIAAASEQATTALRARANAAGRTVVTGPAEPSA